MNKVDVEKILRRAKLKSTSARRHILEILLSATEPLTTPNIFEKLRQNDNAVSETTVYRQLEILSAKNLLRPLILREGVTHYESSLDEEGHHHHLICGSCGKVKHVEIGETEQTLAELEAILCKQTGWKSVSHRLEFPGTCGSCANPKQETPVLFAK